jgi:hypothetical protein
VNPLIDRENLRDALIGIAIGSAIALIRNVCAPTPAPATPTAAQLAPVAAPTAAPAPRITSQMILAQFSVAPE